MRSGETNVWNADRADSSSFLGCFHGNLHVLAPVFSENSVDQVSKEKGISMAQRVSIAIKSSLRQGGEELESLRRVLVQARTEGSRPGENRSNFGAKRTRERFRAEKERPFEAMKLKDNETSFLRGHAAQLTQSLKPILFATR